MSFKKRAMTTAMACGLAGCATPGGVERAWPVMGTTAKVVVHASGPAAAERTVEIVRRAFAHVDATMSNWSADSELSRLNRAAGRGAYRVEDEDLAACVEASLEAARRTGGAFDPTVGPLMTAWGFRPKAARVPTDAELADVLSRVGADKVHFDREARTVRFDRDGMELDLGGIAKGCALDLARAAIPRDGGAGLLDLGGNLAWYGDSRGWLDRATGAGAAVVSIRNPLNPEHIVAAGALPPGMAVATSSDAENHFDLRAQSFGHIMDPRTGRPSATDVVQATAIHPSATVTDILSTALFVAGSARAAEVLAAYPGAEAVLLVREDGRLAVLASRSLMGRLVLREGPGVTADSPRFVLPAATMAPSSDR